MQTHSSLTDYLAELGVDVNNLQEFLLKLSQVLSTSSDSVNINQTAQDGTVTTYLVPSFGYLSNRINNIDKKFNDLLGGNANRLGVKDANGNLRTFELKDMSAVVSDLEKINSTGLAVPADFNYKTNWFFESFLNPLLYVNLDTSTISSDPDVNKFEARRIIITSKIQTDLDYFDTAYKGKNNLDYASVIKDLQNRGIQYFEDTTSLAIPPAVNTARGTFDILNILEDSQSEIIGGQTLTNTIRKYKLNKITYTSINAANSIEKSLKVGDILLTPDNTEYSISSIDTANKTVILTLIFGTGGLSQGSGQLRIKPAVLRTNQVQLNVGYNERLVIFLKPISERLGITTDKLSQGFAIFTNDLTITLNNGKQMTFTQFYQTFVSDFGLMFTNYAKDKKLPASLGETPNRVSLNSANFKVVQVDSHIQDADNTLDIKQKISAKEQASAQIREIDKQITDTRANLNTNASLNESQKLKLQKDLKTFADTRLTLTNTQKSLVSDITTSIKSTPSFVTNPTYHVRGFWAIPEPIQTLHGTQQVIQFKVSYRTLSKTGSSKPADQIEFVDSKGTRITGAFSPWTEYLTKARAKKYNDKTGFYEWADETVSDPNIVNSNQLDIPIKKGEVIEIRIKSLSEAGWPESPIESEWSSSILVEFPASIATTEDATVVSQQAFADESRITFQDELNSKGLDTHLSTSFTTRDKYFAHKAEDIASGFFATDGNIVDLYTKLKSVSDAINAIQTSLTTGKGAISVSIIDQAGNQLSINNGQSLSLFAGYYKDAIKDTSVTPVAYNHGKVIAAQYLIQIQNTSQTPLQLISTLNGGSGEAATASSSMAYPTSNYHVNLRYDVAPITINSNSTPEIGSFAQTDGYQSSQVKSQFIYSRFKNVTLASNLYSGDNRGLQVYSDTTGNYNYQGITISSTLIPYVSGHYVPFDPTLTIGGSNPWPTGVSYTPSTNSNVWNGNLDGTSTPIGGGLLTEFCIHKDHPDIKLVWNATPYNIARPAYLTTDTNQKYLPFSHGIHFEIAQGENTNVFGAKYNQQAEYVKPATFTLGSDSTSPNMRENRYPIKNSFKPNDEWLIGKFTCGAYLSISPTSYGTISVEGLSPAGSYKQLPYGVDAAIKVPLIFQFRASDKLGYIGGWRSSNTTGLKNIKYAKTIGIDIYTSDAAFSFDVTVSAQYEKDTAVIAPISSLGTSSVSLSSTIGA
jgi:hypothetical protein